MDEVEVLDAKNHTFSLIKAILKFITFDMAWIGVIKLIQSLMVFGGPIFLQ